jgi:hypothetical protein
MCNSLYLNIEREAVHEAINEQTGRLTSLTFLTILRHDQLIYVMKITDKDIKVQHT